MIPQSSNNLGFVLMRSGHNAEAVSVFQRAVRLAPNEKLYARTFRRRGRTPPATRLLMISIAREASSSDPNPNTAE